jgi:hypothetical protein
VFVVVCCFHPTLALVSRPINRRLDTSANRHYPPLTTSSPTPTPSPSPSLSLRSSLFHHSRCLLSLSFSLPIYLSDGGASVHLGRHHGSQGRGPHRHLYLSDESRENRQTGILTVLQVHHYLYRALAESTREVSTGEIWNSILYTIALLHHCIDARV